MVSRTDVTDATAQLHDVVQGLQRLAGALMAGGEGEGRTSGHRAFSGPNATSIKHLAQSVKDGRLVTFYPGDLDEVTGYVTGWDDLRQPSPRVFVVVPGHDVSTVHGEPERWLIPFYGTPVRLHSASTAPRTSEDPFYEHYERIVRPFKTHVLAHYYGEVPGKNNKGGATPRGKAAK